MERKKLCCLCSLFVIGIILVVAGITIIAIIPVIFKQNLVIKEGSLQYENWYEPEVPVYMQWYIFNLTNKDNVKAKLEKPRFDQLGPYTYREHRVKQNITWNDNGTVTYQNLRWWNFIPEMSNGSENDTIISLNLPLVTVAESLDRMPFLVKEFFSLLASSYDEELYKEYAMSQLIWGYHDPLMTEAHRLIPDWFYTDFLGVFAGKNYTNDGTWTVYTGENDLNTVGQSVVYNGSKYLNFWSTEWANMVNGTDGTIGKPGLKKDETAYFFIPDVCRSLYAEFASTEKTSEGIELYRFTSPMEELQAPSINPDNAGFCTPVGNCLLGSGLYNMTSCQILDHFNIPVIASLPNLLYADPKYLDAVDGLKPNEVEHRTDVAIEPITGIVMRIAKRLQINIYLRKVAGIAQLADVDDIVFPIAWLNESANIDKPNQDKFNSLMTLLEVGRIGSYSALGVGSALVVALTGLGIFMKLKERQNAYKLMEET